MTPPQEQLIEQAKSGDKEAFTEIFARYRDKIFGYLFRYVRDYHKAEDLVIETFLFAYKRLNTYTEQGKFSSWLYKIATNCAKKEFGRAMRRNEVSLEEPVYGEEDTILADTVADENQRPDYLARETELKELVNRAIGKLEKKYSEVLLLCDVEGLSYDNVAVMLKTNPVTVGTRLRRARKMLHEDLRRYGYEL